MTRELIIDTETTGLHPQRGDRLIEIAAIEVIDRRVTDNVFHFYLDPERDVEKHALEVHGKSWDDLKGCPIFRDVAEEFIEFTRGAKWVIHNAPFDLAFLDIELDRTGYDHCKTIYGEVVDTLVMARQMFPGRHTSLDAMCQKLGINNKHREVHGARIDAELLAEVYLAMTRGQHTLQIGMAERAVVLGVKGVKIRVIEPSAEELAAHRAYLEDIQKESKGRCLWLKAA